MGLFHRDPGRRNPATPATLSRQVSECNRNAASLLSAADHLSNKKLYGPARSLALLAYEEAAKGFIFHSVDQGWATFSKDAKDRPGYVDPLLLRNHPLKQYLILLIELNIHGFALGVRDEVVAKRDPGVHRRLVGPLVVEAGLDPLETWTFNELKNRGLYVEVYSTGVETPADVTREDCARLMDRIKLRAVLIVGFERMPLTQADRKAIGRVSFSSGPIYNQAFLMGLEKRRKAVGTKKFVEEMLQSHAALLTPLRPLPVEQSVESRL